MHITDVFSLLGAERRHLSASQASVPPLETFDGILAAAEAESLAATASQEPEEQQVLAEPDDLALAGETAAEAEPARTPALLEHELRGAASEEQPEHVAGAETPGRPALDPAADLTAALADPKPRHSETARPDAGSPPGAIRETGERQPVEPAPGARREDAGGLKAANPNPEPPAPGADRLNSRAEVPPPAFSGPLGPVSPDGEAVVSPQAHSGWGLVDPSDTARLAPMRAAPATPPAPPAAVGQVAVAIRTSDADHFELRLNPPELGRVQIEMRLVEGSLHAVLLTERADTADLLRRHAETLQRDLEAAGYDTVSLSFGTAGGESSDDHPKSHKAAVAAPAGLATATAAGPIAPATALGHLDIRL